MTQVSISVGTWVVPPERCAVRMGLERRHEAAALDIPSRREYRAGRIPAGFLCAADIKSQTITDPYRRTARCSMADWVRRAPRSRVCALGA
ncbi:hypothetical protein CHELA20_52590 [Hyphomicrobiales bacterium]|nr:hypothetical protein CHELA41_22338 [Hyphomicrobiales bacterium]CAH1682328.1 hypothetical protein CHELA20_52590 [Hyphomicrobiales bacterium]